MVIELSMNTGWSFRDVMKMPMKAFAMGLRHSRKITEDRFSRWLIELTDISAVSWGNLEYTQGLKSHYQERLLTEEQRKKKHNPRLFDADNPDQAQQAAAILSSVFAQKSRMM